MVPRWAQLLRRPGLFLVSLLPWAGATYLHYWLESSQIWAVDDPYRAGLSVIMLAVGMALSFAIYYRLNRP